MDRYLAHHGIKGQKWGVRRFQNPDGSLTDAGKRRAARQAQRQLNNIDRAKVQAIYDLDKAERRARKQLARDKKKDYSQSRIPMQEDLWRKRMAKNESFINQSKDYRNVIDTTAKKKTDEILARCKDEKMSVVSKKSKRFVDTGWRLMYNYSSVPILTLYDGGTKYKVSSK